MTTALPQEQLLYLLQIFHPDKVLARLPGANEALVASAYGISLSMLQEIKAGFAAKVRQAAEELLAEPDFARRVEQLPLPPGAKIVGLGASNIDDAQSWLEILREILALKRPEDGIRIINAGMSGDTTTHLLTRVLPVARQDPDWILCMIGTNDVRRHRLLPTQTLLSHEQTAQNLNFLRQLVATQTKARWIWLTPPRVNEAKVAAHWNFATIQATYRNEDLQKIRQLILSQPDPSIDIYQLFGDPPPEKLLGEDGLHPSLEGQKLITRAVIEYLSQT